MFVLISYLKPKVYELGLKGPPSAVARVPGVLSPPAVAYQGYSQEPALQYDLRTGQYIRAPRTREEVSCWFLCLVTAPGKNMRLLVIDFVLFYFTASHVKNSFPLFQEEEDLQKAIRASLKESRSFTERNSPQRSSVSHPGGSVQHYDGASPTDTAPAPAASEPPLLDLLSEPSGPTLQM